MRENLIPTFALNKFDQPVGDYIFCPWPKQPWQLTSKAQQAETWEPHKFWIA